MPITYTDKSVDAKEAGTRKVKGGGTVDTPARPAYDYKVAKVSFLDGDESGDKTFEEVFDTLAKGNFRNAVKFLVQGANFYAKRAAAPKSDVKQIKALRVLAETLGLSLEETKAKLGIV